MRLVTLVFSALFGAALGSFLNVVVYRVPRGQSLSKPPSTCPACGVAIAWYDNVPVVSWLVLKGQCRTCGASISARYVAIEVATALLFLGVATLVT